jgi:hypothetical protein
MHVKRAACTSIFRGVISQLGIYADNKKPGVYSILERYKSLFSLKTRLHLYWNEHSRWKDSRKPLKRYGK